MTENLTSLDVVNQSFKKSLRGYDPEEVDEFLDLVAGTLQTYAQETSDLKKVLSEKEMSLSEYEKMKTVLQEALILAQKSADERVRSAREQAKKIIADAEKKAESVCYEAAGEAGRLREGVFQVRNIRNLYEQEVRNLLAKYEEMLNNIDADSSMKEAVESVLETYEEEKDHQDTTAVENEDRVINGKADKENLKAAYNMLGVNPDDILGDDEENLKERN